MDHAQEVESLLTKAATAIAADLRQRPLSYRIKARLQRPQSNITIYALREYVFSLGSISHGVVQKLLDKLCHEITQEEHRCLTDQVLLVAVVRSHADLLKHLLDNVKYTDVVRGKALEFAVLLARPQFVKLLVSESLDSCSVQRALLSTDYLPLNTFREMVPHLMRLNIPYDILEYLIIKHHAGQPSHNDVELLDSLLEARKKLDLHPRTSDEMKRRNLTAYLGAQYHVSRLSICLSRGPLQDIKMSSIYAYEPEHRIPQRYFFVDKFLHDSNNIMAKLLERYVSSCTTREGSARPWPLDTVSMILSTISSDALKTREFRNCVAWAAAFRQTTVFARLLQQGALPKSTLTSLSFEYIARTSKLTIAYLDHLSRYFHHDDDYLEMIKPLFVEACKGRIFSEAIHICHESRVVIPLAAILPALATAIVHEEHAEKISQILQLTKVEEIDLNFLWDQVSDKTTEVLHVSRLLFDAGCNNSAVVKICLACSIADGKIEDVNFILKSWQKSIDRSTRDEFDYHTRKSKLWQQQIPNAFGNSYFPTLGHALELAIEQQNFDICQMLVRKDAPLVSDDRSLLGEAVARGNKSSSLYQDKILSLLFDAEKGRQPLEHLLDFTLLQAVKARRTPIVINMIGEGASTISYQCECWLVALLYGDQAILGALLGSSSGHAELTKIFRTTIAEYVENSDSAIDWLVTAKLLHQAGFNDPECYMWLLLRLSHHGTADVDSAAMLLGFGAAKQPEYSEFLEKSLLNGNLEVLRVLTDHSVNQPAAESVFGTMVDIMKSSTGTLCDKTLKPFPRNKVPDMFQAMQLLLRLPMPQKLLDDALRSLALLESEPDRLRAPVLISLLQQGASFADDGGIVLSKCISINDDKLLRLIEASDASLMARKQALRSVLLIEEGTRDPGLHCRSRTVGQLLNQKDSLLPALLTDQEVVELTGIILSPKGSIPPLLLHRFYSSLRPQSTGLCDPSCFSILEKQIQSVMSTIGVIQPQMEQHTNSVAAFFTWTMLRPSSDITSESISNKFWLSAECLDNALIMASRAGVIAIVEALLEVGADPNTTDRDGISALSWAVTEHWPSVARTLRVAGALLGEGYIHDAFCQQKQDILQVLLESGHDCRLISYSHQGLTPLLAFMQYDHSHGSSVKLRRTMEIFMEYYPNDEHTNKELKAAIECALPQPYAFSLISALLTWLKYHKDTTFKEDQSLICKGPFRYSLVSFIKTPRSNYLTKRQRAWLASSLQAMGLKEMYYTTEGDQPKDAINVPDHLLQAEKTRKRRKAYKEKECCIHGEKVEHEEDIHAGLMSTCAGSHGWEDDIVCTDCLKQYLESRMFPHDEISIKYKFPSTKIPCWAPKCPSATLQHSVIQTYADPEIFRLYDIALCQSLLREGVSMVKCATPECPGAHWYERDANDGEEEPLKILFCEICCQNTCTECNDLYEKHNNQPCPAGEEARKSERVKEEEKLSEEALKNEKKCPKCLLLYEKYYGCDHIICGKNVYDNRVDKGCRYEFCDICFGSWPSGHLSSCVHSL